MGAKSRRDRKQLSRNAVQHKMDRDDHDLLVFAVRWLPYGGGPDDEILINFGMSPHRYRECLRDTILRQRAHIHPDTAARLIEMCDPTRCHQPVTIEAPNEVASRCQDNPQDTGTSPQMISADGIDDRIVSREARPR